MATPSPSGPSYAGIPNLLGGLTDTLDKLSRVAQLAERSLGNLFTALDQSLTKLGGQFTRFVALSSPATVERFNLVLRDTMAVIGQVLTPVLIRFTAVVRRLGDALASLDGPTKQMLGGLAAGGGLAGVFTVLATAGVVLVRTLGGIPVLIATLVGAFAGMATTFGEWQQVSAALNGVLSAVGGALQDVAKNVLPPLLAAVGGVLSAVGPLVAALAGGLASTLGSLLGVVTQLLTALTPLLAGLSAGLAPVLEAVGRVAEGVAGVLSALVQALAPLLALAGDVLAALGQTIGAVLAPVVEVLNGVFAALASVIQGVAAVLAPVLQVIGQLVKVAASVVGVFAQFLRIFSTVAELILRVVGALAGGILTVVARVIELIANVLVRALQLLVEVLEEVIGWLERNINRLRKLFGLDPVDLGADKFNPTRRSSAGAAVGQAQFGDIQSVINKAYSSAFSAAGVQDIPKKQLDVLKSIDGQLRQMNKDAGPSNTGGVPGQTAEAIRKNLAARYD